MKPKPLLLLPPSEQQPAAQPLTYQEEEQDNHSEKEEVEVEVLKEMSVDEHADQCPTPHDGTAPLGKRKRKPREIHDHEFAPIFRKRKKATKKKPPASKVKQAVANSGEKSVSPKQEEATTEELSSPRNMKSPTLIRAEEVQASLGHEHPSFLKLLVRSHVGSCFWMGLPGTFCKQHLPAEDIPVILENESGEQFEIKYISMKTGLSAGWRKFVVAHKLVEGDVLIFQLIAPLKFKVYVIRAHDLTEVDGALSLLNLDAVSKLIVAEGTRGLKNKKEHPNSVPLISVKKEKKGDLPTSPPPAALLEERSGNNSDEVASQIQQGKKILVAARFKDVKNFNDFQIVVNGVCIDSELPEQIRRKYYELCCCRKCFLHDRILPGLYCKLAAGMIFEVVSTADAIKRCKLTTQRREFEIWEKSLRSFELLGMNVGFLRCRLRQLIRLAFDSEGASEAKRYWEAKSGQASCEDEIRSLEAKLEGLKEATENYEADIESLRANAESYELMFQECVDAAW